jgi:ubiquinone/menaquinone biosynthesis C-methylase UbiE
VEKHCDHERLIMTGKRSGIYARCIFPWLCDWALDNEIVAEHRRELLAEVNGEVLEIGVGTGLNLNCYPPAVRKITTVEPNPGMNKRLLRRIEQSRIEVDTRPISGESLPFQENKFDYVVSTFTLCSIADLQTVLSELHRVLKPRGRFVFLEHGLSPDPTVQKWQRRLTPIQRLLGDGCRLDVDVRQALTRIPFDRLSIENSYLEKTPRTHGYLYRGGATK